MEKADIQKTICDVVRQIQIDSGRLNSALSSDSCPIGDLDGFDSLSGVEATVDLSEKLGIDLPGVSVFINESGSKVLTIAEIAAKIAKISSEARNRKSGDKQ
jgi:acyl carrier protein